MSVSYIGVHQWVWKRKLGQYCEGLWIHHKQFLHQNLMDNLESWKFESEVGLKAGKGNFGIWECRTLDDGAYRSTLSTSTGLCPESLWISPLVQWWQGSLSWFLLSIVAYLDLQLCVGQFLVIMTLSYPWSRHVKVLNLVTKNTETLVLSQVPCLPPSPPPQFILHQ